MNIVKNLKSFHRKSLHTVSFIIIKICAVLFIAVAFADIFRIADRDTIFSIFGLSYYGIINRRWIFQFATAPFLHAGILHFLFNMLVLWLLGPGVEEKLGKNRYIVLSTVSALFASTAFLLVSRGSGAVAVGYSGVIYGILVAQAVFFPEKVIYIFAFFPVKMKYAVLIFAGIKLYLSVSPEMGSVIWHLPHLSGGAGAFLYLKSHKYFHHSRRRNGRKKISRKTVSALRRARIERDVPSKL